MVLRRVGSLTPAMRALFDQLDPVNQRIMNLIAIMNTEQLMYAFMYDVFRPELILGDRQIEAYEMAAFLRNCR
ncbi:BrxA family protein [Limosilactobacillus fermentum]